MHYSIKFIVFNCLILLFSCKEKKAVTPPLTSVTVTKALEKDVPLYSEYIGQTFGLKDIPIRARVEGFLEKISFKEGSKVKKGQLLYTIDSQPYKAEVATQQGMLTSAKTELIRAQNDLKRIRPLADANAVSKSDLDAAIADEGGAKAAVSAAQANLDLSKIQLGYCKIYSPINGVIGKTQARVGEFVGKDPNPVILNTVSRIESIRVQFFLTESEYLNFMRSPIAKSRRNMKNPDENKKQDYLELILSDGSVHSDKGEINFIDRQVDASTGSILIEASFKNEEGILRPGQFARIRAEKGVEKNAILVPQKAIKELQGKYIITLLKKDNTVESKNITVGEKVGDFWIVKEGVTKGDQVIYEGFQKVRNGMKVKPEFKEFESQTNILEN